MKRKIKVRNANNEAVEREINYIPVRYILAILISIIETILVFSVVAVLCVYIPYFYILVFFTEVFCVIKIINSNDNPDYKVPWLLFVLILPIVGFMTYFMFYSRKISKKQMNKIKTIKKNLKSKDDSNELEILKEEDKLAYTHAKLICNLADTHLYKNTKLEYFDLGEKMFVSMLEDLKKAEKFIFMEYFIIEEGLFWNSILEILKEKANNGVEVKLIYDDIGCMSTLPGNYYKKLKKANIQAIPFSILRGNADNEFNNRNHRKIMVIDNKIGYTGGINIADEYINHINRFGHWKDTGIRLEGEAVSELTNLFLIDYESNRKKNSCDFSKYYLNNEISKKENGYIIPFGDGPNPIYKNRIGKTVIINMLNQAKDYIYITTPYLIIDNDLCLAIENTAKRGIEVKIITPHIPDKKIILAMTRTYYKRLLDAGVEIYEYNPGFIHAKSYISDDKLAMIGTINLDYRSLVHHYENGVWIYNDNVILSIKKDIQETLDKSIKIEKVKENLFQRFITSIVKIFSPLL